MARCTPDSIDERAFDYYPRLSRLRRYCLSNLEAPISLSQAAEQVSLERTYFCTYFRRKVGVSFGQWLTLLRVERALRLLEDESMHITDVATAVGFQSLSAFERAFRSTMGTTAALYRKGVRPTH